MVPRSGGLGRSCAYAGGDGSELSRAKRLDRGDPAALPCRGQWRILILDQAVPAKMRSGFAFAIAEAGHMKRAATGPPFFVLRWSQPRRLGISTSSGPAARVPAKLWLRTIATE